MPVAVKNLYSMIAGIGHIKAVLGVEAQAFGAIEFAIARARLAKTGDAIGRCPKCRAVCGDIARCPSEGELLHTFSPLVFTHKEFAARIYSNPSRHSELARVGTVAPPLGQ